jgi:DNA-binding transcriptional LysR family regulator
MRRVPLGGIEIFLAIAREGSLRGAARSLGLGASAVSHQLKAFEQQIGVELVQRTTRSLNLTRAGRVLLEAAGPAFSDLAAAIEIARGAGRARSGMLRLTLPWSAYKIAIAPIIADFHAAYPDVQVELSFDEALVDVVKEGFHAGIRLGDRLAPGMIAKRITPPLVAAYTASPRYLETHGRPAEPADLFQHQCLRYRFISTNRIADWQFRIGGEVVTVDPPACLIFDSFRSVVQAALDGHGIGWSLRAVVEDEIAAGALEALLEPYVIEHPPFYLYYPEQNRRLELLRLFIGFLGASRKAHSGEPVSTGSGGSTGSGDSTGSTGSSG